MEFAKSNRLPVARTEHVSTQPTSTWTMWDAAMLGVILGATALLTSDLWQPGIPNPGDMLIGLYRVFELEQAWDAGAVFARLGPNINFGYGGPLFQFYPPLFSYAVLTLHKAGLGFIAASKAMLTLNLWIAGVGVYVYARWLTGSRWAAVASSLLYLFAPYLLIVTYERGAAAESTALALLPWLFWSIHHLLDDARFGRVGLAAVLVALVMLAHNISALFMIPTVMLFVGLVALHERRLHGVLPVLAAVGLGLGLSAFYWIPALGEMRFTKLEDHMLDEITDVLNWLLAPGEVLQRSFLHVYQGVERFRLAVWTFVLACLATVGLLLRPHPRRFALGVLLLVFFLIVGMQLSYTEPFWAHMPLVRFIQFPWRLFGMGSLCVALAVGALLIQERAGEQRFWVIARLVIVLAVSAIVSLTHLQVERLPTWYAYDEAQIDRADLFALGRAGFSLFIDYMPRDVAIGFEMPVGRPPEVTQQPPLPAAPVMQIMEAGQNYLRLHTQADFDFPLRFHRIFFPGWQVIVDGRPVPTDGTGPLGLVTATIPAGEHTVTIRFTQTTLRRVADMLSLLSLGILLFGLIRWTRLPRKRLWAAAAVIAVVLIGMAVVQHRASAVQQPTPHAANLDDTIHLLGYHVPTTTLRPGDELALHLYWLVQQTPTANYKVFVHLLKPDDSGRVAQLDQWPALSYNPMTLWEPGEVIDDVYYLPIEPDTSPGTYLLAIGLYHPETVQNLPVLSSPRSLPGDRMVLTEIEIRHDQ